MSTTLFAAISIFSPVRALVQRVWNKLHTRQAKLAAARATRDPSQNTHLARAAGAAGVHRVMRQQPARLGVPSLRVLRIAEAGPNGFHGGRMVISGRIADVCAELDRLAAQEAALQARA